MERDLTTMVSNDVAHALTTQVQACVQPSAEGPLRGSVLVLIQFDVCEEIHLDELRKLFPARSAEARFKNAPAYVQYQRPPVEETLDPIILDSGERLTGEIKYYDYGVVSLVFELPFSGDWDRLIELSCRWTSDTNFEKLASRIVRQRLERAAPALIKPYVDPRSTAEIPPNAWLQEDYFIFQVREITGSPSANDLLASNGDQISQVVRGETALLSEGERQEILGSRISYYPNDLAVIGWNAAFIYDTPAGAETAIQLLQYANSQLLEFRHYDDLMTHELENVYDFLEVGGTGLWSRWRTARAASKLHTVLLDVNELTERADNAIKFLSDMFSARLYKLCAQKVGVPDYKDLVQEKLHTAEDLYRFMVEQFNQSRAFVLELMVVVILIIELVYFFRGKPI
ncbi:MAG TPA: hypothetical protein VKA07_06660 [Candidatus Sulfotelmatobacter sp.]|nr:hypothetical protein [Candidatus Sulfotelmatobacter sp.]